MYTIKLLRALMLCVALTHVQAIQAEAAPDIQAYPPQALPNIDIYDLQGKKLDFEKLDGNVIVLHFWATWCAHCTKEMEYLNALQKRVKKEPIIVIPVSEDFKDKETIEEFYKKHNLKNLLAFIDHNNKLFQDFKIASLPTTVIIDAAGRNVATVKIPIDWTQDKYIKFLQQYITAKAIDNQDYTSVLDEQRKFFTDASSPPKEIPAVAETHITNSSSAEDEEGNPFKIRRPANTTIQIPSKKNE